jgi:carbamoyl-phosphate synthase large subunit
LEKVDTMTNLLITDAGGACAVGVLKSLKSRKDVKITACDANPLASGLYLADKNYTIPTIYDTDFVDVMFSILKREKIDVIFPTGGIDLLWWSDNKDTFEDMGVTLMMSDYKSIQKCVDKLLFYETCKDNFLLPKTYTEFQGYTMFMKPVHGKGSVGARLITPHNQIPTDQPYLFQENLPGVEWTIDALCDMDGNPLSVIPRKRLEVKAGISTKGVIQLNKHIIAECTDMCRFLNLKGPICLQMKEDESGNPKFIEINPRLGGSTIFATHAGVNFPSILLDMYLGKDISIDTPKEYTILRYYEEMVI